MHAKRPAFAAFCIPIAVLGILSEVVVLSAAWGPNPISADVQAVFGIWLGLMFFFIGMGRYGTKVVWYSIAATSFFLMFAGPMIAARPRVPGDDFDPRYVVALHFTWVAFCGFLGACLAAMVLPGTPQEKFPPKKR